LSVFPCHVDILPRVCKILPLPALYAKRAHCFNASLTNLCYQRVFCLQMEQKTVGSPKLGLD
jgi:hypothetical protein